MTELSNRFTFHPAVDEGTKARHAGIRAGAWELAEEWETLLPECRETSLAMTHLEQAMMWANASIARHTDGSCDCHV